MGAHVAARPGARGDGVGRPDGDGARAARLPPARLGPGSRSARPSRPAGGRRLRPSRPPRSAAGRQARGSRGRGAARRTRCRGARDHGGHRRRLVAARGPRRRGLAAPIRPPDCDRRAGVGLRAHARRPSARRHAAGNKTDIERMLADSDAPLCLDTDTAPSVGGPGGAGPRPRRADRPRSDEGRGP
jgi:hypothetical protein